ncbi:SusD/RagB family nutrient-binding outer membrane lipoprotein [Parapedobacter pyrenivorans]|uniref:SusD/RagB family nutrient-binding outer membrane lipoprotein n=1 Tax=Parapedobacter pyrenivorans TaxID=1305674 RepID=UPI003340F20A
MKKTIYSVFGAAALLALTPSCTKNFEALNIDPNLIEKVTPGSLLTPTIYGMSTYFTVRSYDFTWQLMQVGLPNPSVQLGLHRYDVTETAGNGTWNTCYRWLRNIREMQHAADVYGQPMYRAVAFTLQAYITGILTDSFGDVPFSEALQAEEGVSQPKFDTQAEIYTQLIANLEEANTIYAGEGIMDGNDLLYDNDQTKWQKFNNSLLMRLLLRVSKRSEFDSYNRIQNMINNPETYPIFEGNADAALVTITGNPPYNYAWARRQDYVNFEAMSSFFVDLLNNLEDPRRPLFMTEASEMVDGEPQRIGYKGIPSAHSGDASQFNYSPSTPNGNLMIYDAIGTPIKEVIMGYAEVEFIKAEVALHHGDLEASEAAYKKGVEAAITQWNGGEIPADYFENETAAFDGTLERIMTQKYLGLFFNDYQQWFEYRRTGYPVLPKTEYMLHDGVMPTRFMYHNDVRRFNPQNYQTAADRIGGDDVMTKVWWEK